MTVNAPPLSFKNLTMFTMRSRMSCLKSPVEGFSLELSYTSALRGIVTFTRLPRPAFMRAAWIFWIAGNVVDRNVPLNWDRNGSFPTATYLDRKELYLAKLLLLTSLWANLFVVWLRSYMNDSWSNRLSQDSLMTYFFLNACNLTMSPWRNFECNNKSW